MKLGLQRFQLFEITSSITDLRLLEELDIYHCRSHGRLYLLDSLPCLRVLSFSCEWLKDSDFASLSNSTSQVDLCMRNCQKLTSLSPLSKTITLERLCLTEFNSEVKHVGGLSQLPFLCLLTLSGCNIADSCLRDVCRSAVLKYLEIHHWQTIADFSHFGNLRSLEELTLVYCYGVHTGMECLLMLPFLRSATIMGMKAPHSLSETLKRKGVHVHC
ncbi:hypothetical protein ERJ75_001209500 [Trypanosoma vivax]|nr:hypothetical protein ERJ75_001209500 [Trypanosoma vivax]